jgi:aminopeptidase N
MEVVAVEAIHAVRQFLRAAIGRELGPLLRDTYDRLTDTGPYTIDGAAMGCRALRNACLFYLAAADDVALAKGQYDAQANMTDVLAALAALNGSDRPERAEALADFHRRWRRDDLVLDKWFAIQATSPLATTPAEIRALYTHPDFDLRNPNRVRSLVGAFTANQLHFHAADGAGYRFLADAIIRLDPLNSQIAARLVNPLGQWRRQDRARQSMMRTELERILAVPKLSRGTYEKASKGLA